jgi:hypothetical protein
MVGSDKYAKIVLSTDTKPVGAFPGQLIIESDTGLTFEWTGAGWKQRIGGVEIDDLVKSVPTTGTFHHLGHEGKVYVHSDRHTAIANEAVVNYHIRMPAGDSDRQMHMRFGFIGKANTGSLDVDIELYKDCTVSSLGSAESLISTNDANSLSTGILLYYNSTISDYGTRKTWTILVGEKKSASNLDQAVPEWILAPNGASARDYAFKITNNSGGTLDLVAGIFFYDNKAA